jgi:putative transposase
MVAPYAGRKSFPAGRAGTAILIPVTNAIEALNAKLRRAVRARGHFPTDEAALKLLFLVLNQAEKEWTMPAREWCMARAQFAVLFGERFTRAMA